MIRISAAASTTVEGFEIKGGYRVSGVGIYATNSANLRLIDNDIHDNTATGSVYSRGGGVFLDGCSGATL